MKPVLLVHWNLPEAQERLLKLRQAGFEAKLFDGPTPESLRSIRDDLPAAVVIDLGRLPSHGRAVGVALRQSIKTRLVPLVFVDGPPDKVSRVRELLPDAAYTGWSGIKKVLLAAIQKPVEQVAVPPRMSESRNTPLPRKLGIRKDTNVVLLGAPSAFERKLKPLPAYVHLQRKPDGGNAHRVLLFVKSRMELERGFDQALRAMGPKGGLWILWPKRSSNVRTDISQNDIRAFCLEAGLVDYKVCAVDEIWAGLLFSQKKRPKEAVG
ncbi:MAG: hypothetical protein JJE04_15445 [Acidobacteriia bacterium]|nr:hypothetical protein [Terriglobia bacterium]